MSVSMTGLCLDGRARFDEEVEEALDGAGEGVERAGSAGGNGSGSGSLGLGVAGGVSTTRR
jgi:hypothetical protein